MAVRGKLVPQDPEDEPAKNLVEANRKRVLKSRTGKRKEVPELEPSEILIPKGWARCQLADIALVEMGNSPPGSTYNQHGDGVPLINGPVEFSKGSFGLTAINQYTTAPSRMCESGDLLVCVRGATTGRTNIAAFDACIGRGVALIRGWDAQKYLNYLMWWFGEKLLQQGKGTTFPSISFTDLAGLEVLIPPLAEQKRIVAKVDELMALCDTLEAAQQTRNTLRQSLRASALDALMNATSDDELAMAWAFVRDNWGTMSDRAEDVEGLRQGIIQLAVNGRIATLSDYPEAASKIKSGSQASKKKKKLKIFPIEEHPFDLPEFWEWYRLGNLLDDLKYGTSKKCSYSSGGTPVIRIPNINTKVGTVEKRDLKFTQLSEKELCDLCLREDDLLMIRSNGSVSLVGRSAVVDFDTINYAYAGYLVRLRILKDLVFSGYLRLALESTNVREQIEIPIRTTSGVKNINSTEIANLLIPLPPLAEQKRIVAKVDELMKLCDQLEESLRQQQQQAEALMASAISHLAP